MAASPARRLFCTHSQRLRPYVLGACVFMAVLAGSALFINNRSGDVERRFPLHASFHLSEPLARLRPGQAMELKHVEPTVTLAHPVNSRSVQEAAPPPDPALQSVAHAFAAPLTVADAIDGVAQTVPQEPVGRLTGQMLHKSSKVEATVTDVDATREALTSLALSVNGYMGEVKALRDARVLREHSYLACAWTTSRDGAPASNDTGIDALCAYDGSTSVDMTLFVPTPMFDNVMHSMRVLLLSQHVEVQGMDGHSVSIMRPWIASHDESAQDVTRSYSAVLADQSVDEATLAQLRLLLRAAKTVDEVLRMQTEMNAVTRRLTTTRMHRAMLEGQATYADIHVAMKLGMPAQKPYVQPPAPAIEHPWTAVWPLNVLLLAANDVWQVVAAILYAVITVLVYYSVPSTFILALYCTCKPCIRSAWRAWYDAVGKVLDVLPRDACSRALVPMGAALQGAPSEENATLQHEHRDV